MKRIKADDMAGEAPVVGDNPPHLQSPAERSMQGDSHAFTEGNSLQLSQSPCGPCLAPAPPHLRIPPGPFGVPRSVQLGAAAWYLEHIQITYNGSAGPNALGPALWLVLRWCTIPCAGEGQTAGCVDGTCLVLAVRGLVPTWDPVR